MLKKLRLRAQITWGRAPALHVSTPFSLLAGESAYGPGDLSLFNVHFTCNPGSRGSASHLNDAQLKTQNPKLESVATRNGIP
jgi:hypothetical protein